MMIGMLLLSYKLEGTSDANVLCKPDSYAYKQILMKLDKDYDDK